MAIAAVEPGGAHGERRVALDRALLLELRLARVAGGRFATAARHGRERMILATEANYPNARTWVLKLHRDARPSSGKFIGRLENVATGEQLVFGSAEELLAGLARDAHTQTT